MKNLTAALFLGVLVLTGCSTTTNRFTTVDPSNGINRYEAILLAKQEINKAGLRNYFNNLKPIIREDPVAAKYPDYWIVDFTPKIYFDFWGYLVVINKKTGEIIHSRDYYFPAKIADLDWVFGKYNTAVR